MAVNFARAQQYASDCKMIASRVRELDQDTIDELRYAANRLHGHPVTTRDYAFVCWAVERAAKVLRDRDSDIAQFAGVGGVTTNRIKTAEHAWQILDRIRPLLGNDETVQNRLKYCERMIEGIYVSSDNEELWLSRAVELSEAASGTPQTALYDIVALFWQWHEAARVGAN